MSEQLTRIALPITVVDSEKGESKSGLHRFEVNIPKKTLSHKDGFNLNITQDSWYWNDTDRSILIGDKLYYYRNGNFYASRW